MGRKGNVARGVDKESKKKINDKVFEDDSDSDDDDEEGDDDIFEKKKKKPNPQPK